jgi:hypothetical protein
MGAATPPAEREQVGPGVGHMLSAPSARYASELRTLLEAGALPDRGLVDVGMGARLSFELAVRVTLADLTRFVRWRAAGRVVGADRWRQLSADLERLHAMAVARP